VNFRMLLREKISFMNASLPSFGSSQKPAG